MSRERQYLPRWFESPAYLEHCVFCGHRVTDGDVKRGRAVYRAHVDQCRRSKGIR